MIPMMMTRAHSDSIVTPADMHIDTLRRCRRGSGKQRHRRNRAHRNDQSKFPHVPLSR
jgi:hypothetical protein